MGNIIVNVVYIEKLLLSLGWQLEDVKQIVQFSAKMSTDPAFSADVVPKFYLNASVALW